MENETNYKVRVYIVDNEFNLAKKWFSTYDEAKEYYQEQVDIFFGEHAGRNLKILIEDGISTYDSYEYNDPDLDEFEEET